MDLAWDKQAGARNASKLHDLVKYDYLNILISLSSKRQQDELIKKRAPTHTLTHTHSSREAERAVLSVPLLSEYPRTLWRPP